MSESEITHIRLESCDDYEKFKEMAVLLGLESKTDLGIEDLYFDLKNNCCEAVIFGKEQVWSLSKVSEGNVFSLNDWLEYISTNILCEYNRLKGW